VRLGIKMMVRKSAFDVVADHHSGKPALRFLAKQKVDVLLLDVAIRKPGAFEVLHQLRSGNFRSPILMLASMENTTNTARAMALDASGLLYKWASTSEFLEAFRVVCNGGTLWECETLKHVTGILPRSTEETNLPHGVTQRERDVLEQLSHGLTNKEISHALDIGYETVKGHMRGILRKLNLNDRTQAAVWAIRNGKF